MHAHSVARPPGLEVEIEERGQERPWETEHLDPDGDDLQRGLYSGFVIYDYYDYDSSIMIMIVIINDPVIIIIDPKGDDLQWDCKHDELIITVLSSQLAVSSVRSEP